MSEGTKENNNEPGLVASLQVKIIIVTHSIGFYTVIHHLYTPSELQTIMNALWKYQVYSASTFFTKFDNRKPLLQMIIHINFTFNLE
jgi:hypothetical protein